MRQGICKHFRGVHHRTCRLRLNWREITGGLNIGIIKRMPCFADHEGDATCDEFEEPTAQELAEHEAGIQKRLEEIQKVWPLLAELKKRHGKVNTSGSVPCPICGGNLEYAIVGYNGHIQARCNTQGCVSLIE